MRGYMQREALPFTAMVMAECSGVGLSTLYKAASFKGLSYFVFTLYSYALAALLLLFPSLLLLSRRQVLPSPISPLLQRIGLGATLGVVGQLAALKGIEYSSPTLSSAMSSLIPAFTFILALLFRMESLELRESGTQAKVIGTIVSIAGALIVVLYKGPAILSAHFAIPSLSLHNWILATPTSDWFLGGLLLAAAYWTFAMGIIVLAEVMRMCESVVVVCFLYSLIITIITAPLCYFFESNLVSWQIRPDITLVTILYSGVLGSCLSPGVHSWCTKLKGPVYVAMFKPLSIAIAAITSAIFLGDALRIGCIVGSVIICLGFYTLLWGKMKEEKASEENSGCGEDDGRGSLATCKDPLLNGSASV